MPGTAATLAAASPFINTYGTFLISAASAAAAVYTAKIAGYDRKAERLKLERERDDKLRREAQMDADAKTREYIEHLIEERDHAEEERDKAQQEAEKFLARALTAEKELVAALARADGLQKYAAKRRRGK